MPDAWGYGGLVGPDISADAVRGVTHDLAGVHAGWIRVRPNPLHAEAWHDGASTAGVGAFEVARRAHILTLSDDPERVFKESFTSSCRRAVRSAEKAGLEVESDRHGRLVPVFHELLLSSVERWAHAQHEPLALARFRAARRDPLAKFEAWSRKLDGGCQILVARRAGKPIAAMVVLQGRNAHMTRSAMDREAVGHDRPNELLMWHAIQDAVAAGCESFHFGESGTSTSLARYKEKYGAEPYDYAELRVERLPATKVDSQIRGGIKKLVGFRDK
jgi:lipid II:glycine glycyltransferase (peptidoglycan interpeptide bridge formation enzyme)